MNPEAEKRLEEILKKDAENLTADEVAFLNARSPYLNNRQKSDFASVLTLENKKPSGEHMPAQADQKTQFVDPQVQQKAEEKTEDKGNAYAPKGSYDEEE